jgi:hypothetical protein
MVIRTCTSLFIVLFKNIKQLVIGLQGTFMLSEYFASSMTRKNSLETKQISSFKINIGSVFFCFHAKLCKYEYIQFTGPGILLKSFPNKISFDIFPEEAFFV